MHDPHVDERPGPDPVAEAYKAGVDRTLLRESLRLTPEQRLVRLMELQRAWAEIQRAGRQAGLR
jgi:hypothetical protein